MNIRITVTPKTSTLPAPSVQLYRKPHDLEILDYNAANRDVGWAYMGDGYRKGPVRDAVMDAPIGNENPGQNPMPEIYRVYPDHQTPLACKWIKMWRDLNPMLSVGRFETLLGNTLAWTNRTGWPGRYNCLTGKDAGAKDPAFDAARLCGGALVKVKHVDGTRAYLESMLTSEPVPTAKEVLSKPWLWYYGTAITSKGQINPIVRLGTDSKLHRVRVPFLTRLPVYVPLKWLHKLPAGFDLNNYDPTWMA